MEKKCLDLPGPQKCCNVQKKLKSLNIDAIQWNINHMNIQEFQNI